MARTKVKDIRECSADEIAVRLREFKQEALNLRLQQATGQLENSSRIRIVRRETAKILTILSERKRA